MSVRIFFSLFFLFLSFPLFADNSSSFIGYFRTTWGTSEGGGMPEFKVPGAAAKYRLGNEPDTVLEAGVDHRFTPGAEAPEGSYLQGVFMLNGYAAIGNSNTLSSAGLVQAYVKMARYFGDFDVWVGRRYYQRQAIEINDYFWLNTAQGAHVGAGVENLAFASGIWDFAVMNYEDSEVPSLKDPSAPTATLHSRLLELRYRDIAVADHFKLSTWISYTDRPENAELGYEQGKGQGAAAWLDFQKDGHRSTLAAIYRRGLGLTQGPTDARPIRETAGYKLDEASLMELSQSYQWDGSRMSWQFLLLTHKEQRGLAGPAGGDEILWNSLGARPVLFLNEFHSLALELGYDQVHNRLNSTEGSMTKETLAWQLTKQKSAGARPMIRLFLTQAQWSKDLKGSVGGTYFPDKTAGWSAGIQTEVWW